MSQKIYTNLDIKGNTKIGDIANATSDTDKFLVSDAGVVKYRTGSEMLSDLGVAPGVASNVQHQVKAGVAINKGQAVYVTSADGTNMIVGLASNATEVTSSKTMGLLDNTVAINGFANVVTEGLLAGLNTVGANAGDPVWLGTNGNLIYGIANKPYAPAHLVFIGIVTRVNANNGEIFVKAQNGFELDELHDVDLKSSTPIGNQILAFEGAPVNLWKNKSIAAVLGYTPYNASNPAGYISSYTETDTLASVTGRGASTSTAVTLSSGGNTFNGHHYFSAYDANGNHYPHYNSGSNNNGSKLNLRMFDNSGNVVLFYLNGSDKSIQWNGNNIWHAGNLTNLNQLANGPGYISSYTETDPTVPSHVKSITTTEKSNWNTAYGWGNHASAGYALSGHTHDLGRYSLRAPALIDSVTASNFRTQLFGSSTSGYNISTARFNSTPGLLSGLNNYGTMMAWSGSDTHGFLAIDYAGPAAIIGGGNSDNINWTKRLAFLDDTVPNNRTITINGTSYDLSANRSWTVTANATETDTLATVTARGASTSTLSTFDGGLNIGGSKLRWGGNTTPTLAHPFGGSDTGNSLFIEAADGDTGGIIINNDGVTAYGAGDTGFVFRAIDEDSYQSTSNVDASTTFYVAQGTNGGGYMRGIFNVTDYLTAGNSARAPIFYDSNDTSYYLDPNSTSRLLAVNAPSGYTSVGNPWGTSNSAYFPNGITTAGSDNWIYGHTYVGNAPANGAGHEFWGSGKEYHRSNESTTSHGASGRWLELQSASGNFIPYSFEAEYGNHSWGTVARFRINQSGADRPSIQFSNASNDTRWNIGYCYADDNFRIVQNMGYRNDNSTSDGWGTQRLLLDTAGNFYSDGLYQSNASLRSPIFYDSNNTGYYCDPSSASYLNIIQAANRIFAGWDSGQAGSISCSNWFRTNGSTGWYNESYAGGWYMVDSSWVRSYNDKGVYTGGIMQSADSHRAPIFYDLNNTGYYLDPNSVSNLYGITTANPSASTSNTDTHGCSPIKTSSHIVTQSDSNFYPMITGYTTVANQGYINMPSFGYMRPNGPINGDAVIKNSGDGLGAIYWKFKANGDFVSPGDVVAYSDKRVKSNIENITNALDKVKAIRGVTFTRTDSQEGDEEIKHMGVIAQELLSVVPEVVKGTENTNYSVAYGNLAGLFIEAIKEQQKQIEELKELVNQLIKK